MDDGEEPLVVAMPRRELWSLSGLTTQVPMAVLESLQHEAFAATPSFARTELETKQVRLGVIIRRGEREARDVLISGSGVLLHATSVPATVLMPGNNLRRLRDLATAAGRALVGSTRASGELVALLNEDSLPETRPYVVLIYRLQLSEAVAAPPGMLWISTTGLAATPLDPASALAVEAVGD